MSTVEYKESTVNPIENPSEDLLLHYQLAFDYLNEMLFDGKLKPCVLNFATHGRSQGYFTPGRWEKSISGLQERKAHEISLNPALLNESTETILAVLARQMVHLWQIECGEHKPHKFGYFNREHTQMLEAIGIPASVDGTPEGEKTGYRMRHWIEPTGKFQEAMESLPEQYFFPWRGSQKPNKPKRKMVKYGCPVCGMKGIFPRDVHMTCNTFGCNTVMERLG